MKSIFSTNYLGSKVEVFDNRIEWSLAFKRNSVPINTIASIELGIPLYAQVVIETTGGKKLKIPVAPGQKKKLRDAIYEAQSAPQGQSNEKSNLDEIEKLAQLKEKGILTEEEYNEKKKQLLDSL